MSIADDARDAKVLATAVLLRVIDDLQLASWQEDIISRADLSARNFCFSRYGDWADAREAWCDLAGIDPDYFSQRAQRVLATISLRRERRSLVEITAKSCIGCCVERELSAFRHDSRTEDGFTRHCGDCLDARTNLRRARKRIDSQNIRDRRKAMHGRFTN